VRKPFVIWATALISTLVAAASIYGLSRRIDHLAFFYRQLGSAGFWPASIVIIVQACFSVFVLAVTYAAFKRPRWARGICCAFALLLSAVVIFEAVHPDPHPRFPIEPGAQEVGALFGRILMAALALTYAYAVALGSKARAYFSNGESPPI
jgi:hypothetical protein